MEKKNFVIMLTNGTALKITGELATPGEQGTLMIFGEKKQLSPIALFNKSDWRYVVDEGIKVTQENNVSRLIHYQGVPTMKAPIEINLELTNAELEALRAGLEAFHAAYPLIPVDDMRELLQTSPVTLGQQEAMFVREILHHDIVVIYAKDRAQIMLGVHTRLMDAIAAEMTP